MRKSISFYLLPVLLTVLCLSSCSETGQKTEYTHVIPANATEVAALDLKSIVDKAGLNTSDSRATLQKFLGLLLEGGSANLKQEAETLLKDPAESGIDWNAPLYVFEAPTLHNTAITLKIADLKKFEAMLRLLVQEQLCTAPVEAGQQLGTLYVTAGEQTLAELPLVAPEAVPRLGWWQLVCRMLAALCLSQPA